MCAGAHGATYTRPFRDVLTVVRERHSQRALNSGGDSEATSNDIGVIFIPLEISTTKSVRLELIQSGECTLCPSILTRETLYFLVVYLVLFLFLSA